MNDIPRIELKEFQDSGFLLEANRCFFHPLGLALAVEFDEDGNPNSLFVFDGRDDPDGFLFGDLTEQESIRKHEIVRELWQKKAEVREQKYGWNIQPIGSNLGEES